MPSRYLVVAVNPPVYRQRYGHYGFDINHTVQSERILVRSTAVSISVTDDDTSPTIPDTNRFPALSSIIGTADHISRTMAKNQSWHRFRYHRLAFACPRLEISRVLTQVPTGTRTTYNNHLRSLRAEAVMMAIEILSCRKHSSARLSSSIPGGHWNTKKSIRLVLRFQ
ncbi:uncharacterized protein BT62DRAFT_1075479 [Guyanagaster necrorhizus]|uniref:Uncharacterized protein n=1 Tax=Guyanagaster necrorhizus TaxID=856835 RepID=A0A9P8ATW2_9AGAR|nr:uncharacterized protein BT62DRAFT_1075479 [Guyanagaster necrorhizus MCA 3950]KAG7447426.1 hypothetical protein BT62DRAFT_1075479 [Guyanagaster necrorhizus MCA 3950]